MKKLNRKTHALLLFLTLISFITTAQNSSTLNNLSSNDFKLGEFIGHTQWNKLYVIPLYQISANSLPNSNIIGRFISQRIAYNPSPDILDVNFRFSSYAGGNRNDINWIRTGSGINMKPVIFTYNSLRYFGLHIIGDKDLFFKGSSVKNLNGTSMINIPLNLIQIYDGNTSIATNLEIYNSLEFDLESETGTRLHSIFTVNDSGFVNKNSFLAGIDYLAPDSSGNVGIGTTNTKGFKLGVNGKIAATEVKIATYANWSDFVFEKEYNLPTLKEVETHIKEKGHLKDIPSAKEVAKSGIFLGEINAKLLQKIEELTLYTIEQEKKLTNQENEIKELKKERLRNNLLEKRLLNIEKLIKEKL